MTEAAVGHLAGLKNLRKLNVAGTRITTAGRQRLAALLPKAAIAP